MNVDLLELFISIMESYRVQLLLLKEPYDNISQMDFQFRSNIYENYDYSQISDYITSCLSPDTLLTVKDDLGLSYTAFRFPPALPNSYPYEYALIGPYLFQPVTTLQFRETIEKKKALPSLYQDFQEYFNRIPLISNPDIWNSILINFVSPMIEDTNMLHFSNADFNLKETLHPNYTDYQLKENTTIARSIIEERYQSETALLNAVSNGNVKEALSYLTIFLGYRLVPRISDPVRNQKNLCFALNTMTRKAVQSASVHPLHIDTLSTQLAIQIENSTNLHQLEVLMTNMIRKYCLLVKSYSRKSYSSLVQTCLDYIDFHYQEDLSLDSMAKLCSVSNSYLSTLFRKEVDMTLTDYLNKTRIRQALILLNTTNSPIQTIGEHCGFGDSNYFARIFKKYQGQSPKQYRDSIRQH